MKRRIEGLKWAMELAGRPSCVPVGRPRGQKAWGIRYERAVAAELPAGSHMGVWFEFEDLHGRGYCQVDGLVPAELGCLGVLEIKYTWTQSAFAELRELYLPVVGFALGTRVRGIQVCKVLTPQAGTVTGDLRSALAMTGLVTWHCLGLARAARGPCLRGAKARPKAALVPLNLGF
jgi:hypothetical protein